MRKKTAFLIAPFSGWMDQKDEELRPDKRALLENIIAAIEEQGIDVRNAHRRENWGRDWWPTEDCTTLDHEWARDSDYVVALPESSGGVHMELGWRTAHGGNLLLLLEEGRDYSPLVEGAEKAFKSVTTVRYRNQGECPEIVRQYLGEHAPSRIGKLLRIARPVAAAASIVAGVGMGYLAGDYRAPETLEEARLVVLSDFARGLEFEGKYVGTHGTVVTYGNHCIMHSNETTHNQADSPRFFGISRTVALKYVDRELKKMQKI